MIQEDNKEKQMENNKVIFYTTHCPKCTILEKKLKEKAIKYFKNDDMDEMLSLGFMSVPMLKIEEQYLNFEQAIKWLKNNDSKKEQINYGNVL